MDPKARRALWNCILSIIKEGRSVVLTSHRYCNPPLLACLITVFKNELLTANKYLRVGESEKEKTVVA